MRKVHIRRHADETALDADKWVRRNAYYHERDLAYLRFLVPEGARVLDLGCGTGDRLAALRPSCGIGIDLSPRKVARARASHPGLTFICGDVEDSAAFAALGDATFDFIVMSDTLGFLEDCQATFEALQKFCHRDTRLVVGFYSYLWEPVLRIGEALGLKKPQVQQNFLRLGDIENLLALAGYDMVKQERRLLLPKRWLGLGPLVNAYLGPLPLFRRFCLRNYTVARSLHHAGYDRPAVSVVVPCRNERGNIADVVARMPCFWAPVEVIFIEGHSRDGTLEEIERVIAGYSGPCSLRVAVQDGVGKGDAVRKGFDMAEGDILMILDADLTVTPEDLPKFYRVIASGLGEFANGSRLVYPLEPEAMRHLNLLGNAFFARMFSWLLNQRVTDTLCGTKVMSRAHYRRIAGGRSYFGDFDPFGDFDLIFGAAKLNLKIIDVPIRYRSRAYGETQIDRVRHGFLLLRMVWFAFRKLKAL